MVSEAVTDNSFKKQDDFIRGRVDSIQKKIRALPDEVGASFQGRFNDIIEERPQTINGVEDNFDKLEEDIDDATGVGGRRRKYSRRGRRSAKKSGGTRRKQKRRQRRGSRRAY